MNSKKQREGHDDRVAQRSNNDVVDDQKKPSRKSVSRMNSYAAVPSYAAAPAIDLGRCSNTNLAPLSLPFPWKLYQLLEDSEVNGTGAIISWLPDGKSMIIYQPDLFVKEIMGSYFEHMSYRKFVEELDRYGFTCRPFSVPNRIPNPVSILHPKFLREDRNMCLSLRRKPTLRNCGPSGHAIRSKISSRLKNPPPTTTTTATTTTAAFSHNEISSSSSVATTTIAGERTTGRSDVSLTTPPYCSTAKTSSQDLSFVPYDDLLTSSDITRARRFCQPDNGATATDTDCTCNMGSGSDRSFEFYNRNNTNNSQRQDIRQNDHHHYFQSERISSSQQQTHPQQQQQQQQHFLLNEYHDLPLCISNPILWEPRPIEAMLRTFNPLHDNEHNRRLAIALEQQQHEQEQSEGRQHQEGHPW